MEAVSNISFGKADISNNDWLKVQEAQGFRTTWHNCLCHKIQRFRENHVISF